MWDETYRAGAMVSPKSDIMIHKISYLPGEQALPEEHVIQIFTPKNVMDAFVDMVKRHMDGKFVYNTYFNTTTELATENMKSFHLQLLARNEGFNVTGIINHELYPGISDENRFLTVRILRCLVKCSIVASIVTCRAYGGYPRGEPVYQRDGEIILIDQSGFQWQREHFNTGGIFFYSDVPIPFFNEWREQCYRAFFEQEVPPSPAAPINVTWSGLPGRMCEEQLKRGFRHEFLQAFHCANEMAQSNEKEKVYFRFLKAGLGFFCDRLDETTQSRLPVLRLQGIEQALCSINALGEEHRVRYLELPYSGIADPVIGRIAKACKRVEIKFIGVGDVDALTPLDPQYGQNTILAVTNCADPHAAIGNEGGYGSVDAAIATNTNSTHMIVAARVPDMSTEPRNVINEILPPMSHEVQEVSIKPAQAQLIYTTIKKNYDQEIFDTMMDKNNKALVSPEKMRYALNTIGVDGGELVALMVQGYKLFNLPVEQYTTLMSIIE